MEKISEFEDMIQFEEIFEQVKCKYTMYKDDTWYLAQQEAYDKDGKKVYSIEALVRDGEYYRFDIDSDYYRREIRITPRGTIQDRIDLKGKNITYNNSLQQETDSISHIDILEYLNSNPRLKSQDGTDFEDNLYGAIKQYLEKNEELKEILSKQLPKK